MKILVSGASGMTGRAVISALRNRADSIAMVSNPASGARALEHGASEFRVADFRDPPSLVKAMHQVDAVYHICPRMQPDEEEIGRNMIGAAQEAGVQLFGFHSVIRAAKERIVFHWSKLKVEMALVESGLPYIIVQPTNYMENVSWTWPLIVEEGRYLLPYSADVAMTWVAVSEIGEAIANALLDPSAHLGTYELAGPDGPLTRHDVCGMLSTALGRSVRAEVEPIDAYFARPRFEGRPQVELDRLRTMFDEYDAHGLRAGAGLTLGSLLGRAPIGYSEWITQYAQKQGD